MIHPCGGGYPDRPQESLIGEGRGGRRSKDCPPATTRKKGFLSERYFDVRKGGASSQPTRLSGPLEQRERLVRLKKKKGEAMQVPGKPRKSVEDRGERLPRKWGTDPAGEVGESS